ncbi:MAG: hypothetical protein ABI647_10115 [Gemmatimonadota bacterium]
MLAGFIGRISTPTLLANWNGGRRRFLAAVPISCAALLVAFATNPQPPRQTTRPRTDTTYALHGCVDDFCVNGELVTQGGQVVATVLEPLGKRRACSRTRKGLTTEFSCGSTTLTFEGLPSAPVGRFSHLFNDESELTASGRCALFEDRRLPDNEIRRYCSIEVPTLGQRPLWKSADLQVTAR